MTPDYSAVTEVPGYGMTEEGLRMLATRYRLAADHAADKDVLEVAAGAGMGLGLLARRRRVVGTDITPSLTRVAHATYRGRLDVATTDAQAMPFRDASFDVVLLYEAIYYLPDVDGFFREARRVLRPGGVLILCTANKLRSGFVRSPHSHAYYDSNEITALYHRHGFDGPDIRVAFEANPPNLVGMALLWGFGMADRLHLIPRSLEGRARVKRLLYGPLTPTPAELTEETALGSTLAPLPSGGAAGWKVIYAVGERSGTADRAAPT